MTRLVAPTIFCRSWHHSCLWKFSFTIHSGQICPGEVGETKRHSKISCREKKQMFNGQVRPVATKAWRRSKHWYLRLALKNVLKKNVLSFHGKKNTWKLFLLPVSPGTVVTAGSRPLHGRWKISGLSDFSAAILDGIFLHKCSGVNTLRCLLS